MALIDALRTPEVGNRADRTLVVYRSLVGFSADDYPEGRSALIHGLNGGSQKVQRVCCEALSADVLAAELNARLERLSDVETPDLDKERILRTLSGCGPSARLGVGAVIALLKDYSQPHRLRAFAAGALLNIADPVQSVQVLSELDATGLRLSMGPLARFAGETEGKFGTDDESARNRMRAFIRHCLENPDREVRELAANAFLMAYGKDTIWITDAAGRFSIRPEYREAWEFVARHDPVEELRANALRRLAEIDRVEAERNAKE